MTDEQPSPALHASDVHWTAPQLAEPVHVTSHAHELLQATVEHELEPEQLTAHPPRPHSTLWQLFVAEHAMLHDSAAEQLMPLRHELSVSHKTSQL